MTKGRRADELHGGDREEQETMCKVGREEQEKIRGKEVMPCERGAGWRACLISVPVRVGNASSYYATER